MTTGDPRHAPATGAATGEPSMQDRNAIVTLAGEGRYAEAAALAHEMTVRFPVFGFGWKALGAMLKNMGRDAEALAPMQRAAALSADDASAHYNLASTLQELGRLEEAESSYRQAIRIRPDYAEAHNNLANVLYQAGRRRAAEASYREALRLKPDYADAHNNLGNCLQEMGYPDQAEASYRRALNICPGDPETLNNLGNSLKAMGRSHDAEVAYRQALEIRPDFPEAHSHLGVILHELGRESEAEASLRRALQLNPDYAEAYNSLGNCLGAMRRFDEAEASYRRALQLMPDYAEAYCNLGSMLQETVRQEEAEACLQRALQIRPEYPGARWRQATCRIPIMAGSYHEAMAARATFARELDALDAWFDSGRADAGFETVGLSQPFYLAYQEENNRDLLAKYGALCARLMKHWQDREALPSPRLASGGGPIRVGVASAHLYNHSVWNAIVKGWFQHLDRGRIELHAFHLGRTQDEGTRIAASRPASFAQGLGGFVPWVRAIREKQLDVLIYPEVGMDPMAVKLASLRLAPIQMASWGHPETTGLPTIDYYLSAECLEPPDAQANYTEQLVCLPRLGCCYHAAEVVGTEPDLTSLGIQAGVPLLLCPGLPFKYAPQHDRVFVEIARALGRCQFAFFTSDPGLSGALHERLRAAFAGAGLNFDEYGAFVPWQDKSGFYGLMQRADVFLDTIGFSGFNTAMQAVECGLPVVTREGRFMRGRLASGILRRLGVTELIAGSEAEYVELAVRLARDAEFQRDMRRRIEAARHVLFDDVESVRALEEFIVRTVAQARLTQA